MTTASKACKWLTHRDHRYLLLGLIGAGSIALLLFGATAVPRLGLGQAHIVAEFAQAAGIKPGDDVQIAGVIVGKVQSAELAGNHVRLALNIDSTVELGSDTEASIKMSTILGARYVAIQPSGSGSLQEKTIPLSKTSVPYDLARTIEVGEPVLSQIDGASIGRGLDSFASQLQEAPALTTQALDNISTLSNIINQRSEQVSSLLNNANEVTKMLSDNRSQLITLVGQGQALAGEIMRRRDLLGNMLTETAAATDQLQLVLGENSDKISPAIEKLNELSRGLRNNDAALGRLYEQLPAAARQLANAFGNGNYADVYAPWAAIPDNWLCTTGVVQGCR